MNVLVLPDTLASVTLPFVALSALPVEEVTLTLLRFKTTTSVLSDASTAICPSVSVPSILYSPAVVIVTVVPDTVAPETPDASIDVSFR